MKIAFDFHGVLDKYPAHFLVLTYSLVSAGHYVTILSGPPKQQLIDELKEAGYNQGIHFQDILSVVDWLTDQGVEMKTHPDGSKYCDEYMWWSSKAKICKEIGIDMLFDDQLQYKGYFREDSKTLFMHIQ